MVWAGTDGDRFIGTDKGQHHCEHNAAKSLCLLMKVLYAGGHELRLRDELYHSDFLRKYNQSANNQC
jgi:hypothetical protein